MSTTTLTATPFDRYTRAAMALHWLIALAIAVNVALGWGAESLPEDWVRPAIDTHKSIGITVLGLALLRVLWRLGHRPPPMPRVYAPWQRALAWMVHMLLYASILALPLTGWAHDSAWKGAPSHPMSLFGVIPWPRIGWIMDQDPATKEALHDQFGAWHAYAGYVLYALFALHLLGALKHELVDGHRELRRMWS